MLKIFRRIRNVFSGNRFFNFNGVNNKLIIDKYNLNLLWLFAFSKFKIKGNNNVIIFRGNFRLKHYFNIIKSLKLYIYGDNNLIDIEFPMRFDAVLIGLQKDNNSFKIKETIHPIRDARFFVEDGGSVSIGKNSELKNRGLHVVVNNGYKNKPKLVIGDNVFIAKDAIIRTSDGHSLIDPISKIAINEPEDVIIGNNVWITSRCTILKGSHIPDNSVVGACSLVNKKFTEPNVVIAGVPAKVIRENICWDFRNFGSYMSHYESLKENING